mmetsp:Transcript_86749/g.190395  ORF Transcript_86749/g.190395 Transcript_86749/m.190395 type:complete len:1687 (+) Transcript_86749:229-5289(+)
MPFSLFKSKVGPTTNAAGDKNRASGGPDLFSHLMELGSAQVQGFTLAMAGTECREVAAQLDETLHEHPYLARGKAANLHPLTRWVELCLESIRYNKAAAAKEHYDRIVLGLKAEARPIEEAFKRFDADNSGQLDSTEFKYMCAYLGWGAEEADLMDLDGDGKVSLPEFQQFVGAFGGIQQIFAMRRERVAKSRKDVCEYDGVSVGARVKSYYYVKGEKSKTPAEAQVLALGAQMEGGRGQGIQLEFGIGSSAEGGAPAWKARQVVPVNWIASDVEDDTVASALREVGILDEHQSFWSLLLPESEMKAVAKLVPCQRAALSLVRRQSTEYHDQQLEGLKKRFLDLKYSEADLQAVFGWLQDLAPICVHVGLDGMGHFLESDDFYRSQFETKTSCGAGNGDSGNSTRKRWEHELFGGCYDECKPFDRCKYGALNVMNDYHGVVTARQYGDSYLILKDVRLRCTFASEDSGGMEGARLAVLDKYAHVLAEFNDEEVKALVAIAQAIASPENQVYGSSHVQLLRGSSEDPTSEWITMGCPKLAQKAGLFYFEVQLYQDTGAPQVGLLSADFQVKPGAYSQEGVGDDEHGWAIDVLNVALWHKGKASCCTQSAASKEISVSGPGQYAWQRITSQALVLEKDVTLGVAVDLNKRMMWFTINGEYKDEPDFKLPANSLLYPAISLKGRAAFNFSGEWKHKPPTMGGRIFTRWPNVPEIIARLDCPYIGDENTVDCYKEVQIHGEVSLKRNVQRLVAADKYRNAPKNARNYNLVVGNSGKCNGTYVRSGAYNNAPLYKCMASGSSIWYNPKEKAWCLSQSDERNNYRFFVTVEEDNMLHVPRKGWQVHHEEAGRVPADMLEAELKESFMEESQVADLIKRMGSQDSKGRHIVLQSKGTASVLDVAKELGFTANLEPIWKRAVQRAQQQYLTDAGFADCKVVESLHPYLAKNTSETKSIHLPDTETLKVAFASKCGTFDSDSQIKIFAGGLHREAAGPGARVEVKTSNDSNGKKVTGTLVERAADGHSWKVRLDRKPIEPEAPALEVNEYGIHSWPLVGDAVEGKYSNGRWFKATVVDIDVEIDWYSATRRAMYTVEWADGDKKDRLKTWENLRRPQNERPLPTVNHCFLDDVPGYGAVAPRLAEAFATCSDEHVVRVVTYSTSGLSIAFTDAYEQHHKIEIVAGNLMWSVDGGDATKVEELTINRGDPDDEGVEDEDSEVVSEESKDEEDEEEEKEEEAFHLDAGFTSTFIEEPAPGEAQFALMVKLHKMCQQCKVTVRSNALAELREKSFARSMTVHLGEHKVAKIGDEIKSFRFDETSPLSPIRVEAWNGPGPAQDEGVEIGWFLDLEATANTCEPFRSLLSHVAKLDGKDTPVPTLIEKALQKRDTLMQHLNQDLLASRDMILNFERSAVQCQPRVLPEAYLYYSDDAISTDIKSFHVKAGRVQIESFLNPRQKGVARTAGVFTDWVLDLPMTVHLNENRVPALEESSIMSNPNQLLSMTHITLAFKQPDTGKAMKFSCGGPRDPKVWKCEEEFMGSSLDFTFVTDGDGTDEPDKRWGYWALVYPGDRPAPSQETVDDLAQKWSEVAEQAEFVKEPEVKRDGWDEARLRALCAKHGWEFEWMSEDGERRRRIRDLSKSQTSRVTLEKAKEKYMKHAQTKVARSSSITGTSSVSSQQALPDGAIPSAGAEPK